MIQKVLIILTSFAAAAYGLARPKTLQPLLPLLTPRGPRITNGEECYKAYQGYIVLDGKYFCGASIISDGCLLTAAHCIVGSGDSYPLVHLGTRNIYEEAPVMEKAIGSKVHEEYNAETLEHDVAIIWIPPEAVDDAMKSGVIEKINLVSGNDLMLEGESVTASGWGKTSDDGPLSDEMNCVDTTVISRSRCQREMHPIPIAASHLCCSGRGGKSTCNGDSGGPVVYHQRGRDVLAAIISFGTSEGCEKGFPHVSTRTSPYEGWIKRHCPDAVFDLLEKSSTEF